jgi:hypothetical protein
MNAASSRSRSTTAKRSVISSTIEVDILGLSKSEFRIRTHNPGGTTETRYVEGR